MQVSVADWRALLCRWSFLSMLLLPTAPMPLFVDLTGLPEARQDPVITPTEDGTELAAFAGSTDAFLVLHRGKLVWEWYGGWGAADGQHIIFSISKSLTALLTGIPAGRGVLDTETPVSALSPKPRAAPMKRRPFGCAGHDGGIRFQRGISR